jgi:rhodanese-related sulfurtransferase
MKNKNLTLLVIALAIMFSGCFKPDKSVYDDLGAKLEAAIENVDFVKAEKLSDIMELATEPLAVIDVREPEEFEAGHIPGAINIPRGTLEFSNLLSNRRQTVVLYSNAHQRSALSVNNLKLMKYGAVKVLEGGFENWQEIFPERVEEGPGSLQGGVQAKQVSSGGCGD